MRLTLEEKTNRVFDELCAADRLDIDQLAERTRMKRPAVYQGIRGNRDTLGDEALVCSKDGFYELAMTDGVVTDYRYRRLKFIVNSLRRLQKILEAGQRKFGNDDTYVATKMISTAIEMLERGMGGSGSRRLERVS